LANAPPINGLKKYNLQDIQRKEPRVHAHPTVDPIDHAIGRNEKACAAFVESVISPMTLFITPMLPLNAPCMHRFRISIQYCLLNPKLSIEMARPSTPPRSMGRLPMESEARPQ